MNNFSEVTLLIRPLAGISKIFNSFFVSLSRLGLADVEAGLIESGVNDNTGAEAGRRRMERAGDRWLPQGR